MYSLAEIVRQNNETFYDYASNRRYGIGLRIWIEIVASAFVAIFVDSRLNDFLNGTIAVQAILVGFSFSVMFFLMASLPPQERNEGRALEDQLKLDRIFKLSRELFFNLSYFICCATASLALALFLLLPDAGGQFTGILKATHLFPARDIATSVGRTENVIAIVIYTAFFFLIIESGYTFARTVGRINFLFTRKLDGM